MTKLLDNYKADEIFNSAYWEEKEAIVKRELDKRNLIREKENRKHELNQLEKRFDGAFEDLRNRLDITEELLYKAFNYINELQSKLNINGS